MSKRNGKANGKAPAPDFRAIVDTITDNFGKELADSIPELNEAVAFAGGEASFSVTLQIKKAKGGRFKATLKSRVRAPREPLEFDMHLNDATGQLEMGFDPAIHGVADGDEAGEGAGATH